MIENNKLPFGLLLIVVGTIYLFFLFKRRNFREGNTWDKSMFIRGIIGGIFLIIIGIVAILMYFGIW
ncbi:hypothetical protein [Abyssalbus ytuae]|uniref:Uncharacterized protein n=1 Tax=Abyssalbus ytuae TaxID=2926907 RepID=A0A9E6ZPD0_9FLAO|nr:hypothetical protein [Abyssalbus ytuae]UOB16293.1 hypothetical protein MQE35_11145 [Abyssalbus ytuae]